MGILSEILGGQNGQAIGQLAQRFGLDPQQTQAAVQSLLPAISSGLQRNLHSTDSHPDLLNALQNGQHQRYLDEPGTVTQTVAVDDGNAILGHLFGSKDTSRQLASQAAAATGLHTDTLKQMLPMVANLAMGVLGKQASRAGLNGQSPGGSGDGANPLGSLVAFLDMDNDGSVTDDLLRFAKKLF